MLLANLELLVVLLALHDIALALLSALFRLHLQCNARRFRECFVDAAVLHR